MHHQGSLCITMKNIILNKSVFFIFTVLKDTIFKLLLHDIPHNEKIIKPTL